MMSNTAAISINNQEDDDVNMEDLLINVDELENLGINAGDV
jgi:hypothetical protein